MRIAELAVRTGADAKVVTELPVVQVVRALMARARIGRDLVALQARGGRELGDAIEHLARRVVVGHGRRMLGKEGVGLDRQVVDAQVRRLEGQRLPQIRLELGQRLLRQRIHQVDIESVEGRGGLFDRGHRLGAVVHAAERLQLRVVEALHADRQARDAGGAKRAEALALEGAGVGFQRDLAAGLQRQPRAHVGEQPIDRFGREQARRAAADEDAHDAAAPHQRQDGIEIGAHGVEVAVFRWRASAPLVGIEVAIWTLLQAPRQVHVQRQRRRRAELQGARPQISR